MIDEGGVTCCNDSFSTSVKVMLYRARRERTNTEISKKQATSINKDFKNNDDKIFFHKSFIKGSFLCLRTKRVTA